MGWAGAGTGEAAGWAGWAGPSRWSGGPGGAGQDLSKLNPAHPHFVPLETIKNLPALIPNLLKVFKLLKPCPPSFESFNSFKIFERYGMTVSRVSIVSIVLGLRLKLSKLSYIWCPPPPPMSLPFSCVPDQGRTSAILLVIRALRKVPKPRDRVLPHSPRSRSLKLWIQNIGTSQHVRTPGCSEP